MIFSETRETYTKIATLYYLGEQSQDDIAKSFGISRFKVSRILKRCRELSIVEFRIDSKPHYYSKLEAQIEELLPIKKCIVVSPGSTDLKSKINVGRAAAKYLEDTLKDDMIVGFDWGSTIQTMVSEFSPKRKCPGSLFVQICGSAAPQSAMAASYMDGHDIVKGLAVKAGANWSLFPVPYIVDNEELRDMLYKEKTIRNHIAYFNKLDMVFGGVASNPRGVFQPFYENCLTADECSQLLNEDCTGEIYSYKMDIDGNVTSSFLTSRVLAIDAETVKRVPETVVLAAGRDKALPLISGSRGGYFNTLIISGITALSILEFFEGEGVV